MNVQEKQDVTVVNNNPDNPVKFGGYSVEFAQKLGLRGIKIRDPEKVNAGDIWRKLDRYNKFYTYNSSFRNDFGFYMITTNLIALEIERMIREDLIFPADIQEKLSVLFEIHKIITDEFKRRESDRKQSKL